MLNLVSVQPCAGRENKERDKVKIIFFQEIKVTGNIHVIQYFIIMIFMGSGWPMFSENTVKWYDWYQQDLQPAQVHIL